MNIKLNFSYPLVMTGYLSLYYIYASLTVREKNKKIKRCNRKIGGENKTFTATESKID